jgi:hypothetical protein
MTEATPKFENHDYEILHVIRGSARDGKHTLGDNGKCRFCDETARRFFRNASHTFPQGLGNKWIFSADECDRCNALFGKYDDALCKSVALLLTIGGVKGKGGKTRQTGRSEGSHNFRHQTVDGEVHIKTELFNKSKNIDIPQGTSFTFVVAGDSIFDGAVLKRFPAPIPTPVEKFIPRYAYKCLVKMGFALIPNDELHNFTKLKKWLQTPDDNCDFPFLDVGISTGSLSNPPEVVGAVIFRRRQAAANRPEYIFCFCAGSICWQIELRSDSPDADPSLIKFGQMNVDWTMFPRDDDTRMVDRFTIPRHFDLKSNMAEPPLVADILHMQSPTEGDRFGVKWRS